MVSSDPTKPGSDDESLASKVLRCYTTQSVGELTTLFEQVYHPKCTFADPLVVASPRHEARLQFISLKHLFSRVDTQPPHIIPSPSDPSELRMQVQMEYYWNREGSRLAQWLLPEKTAIEMTTVLTVDQASGKVMEHVDEWRSPGMPMLPTPLRKANMAVTNFAFRLLGWEKGGAFEGRRDGEGLGKEQ